MIVLAASLFAGTTYLACELRDVSANSDRPVGAAYSVDVTVALPNVIVGESDRFRLSRDWNAAPGWHGAVELNSASSDGKFSGMIIPGQKGGFSIFWADNDRKGANGAPKTMLSGSCTQAKAEKNA